MGTFGGAQPIVTDGLVFAVDAANYQSYPGSGTTWNDMVGGNNGTLVNGPTFDEANGGSISFDSTDDVIVMNSTTQDTFNQTWDNGLTICSIIRVPESPRLAGDGMSIFARSSGGASYNAFNWSLQIRGSTTHGDYKKLRFWLSYFNNSVVISSTALTSTTPYYCCVVYNPLDSTNKIYINGELDATRNNISVNPTTISSMPMFIGGGGTAFSGWEYDGNIYQVKAYNRALSPSEITQNYNALKSRFGLT